MRSEATFERARYTCMSVDARFSLAKKALDRCSAALVRGAPIMARFEAFNMFCLEEPFR